VTRRGRGVSPGEFLRIPLGDGSFGYGRAVSETYIAFYDYRTSEPSADLDAIDAKPVLFTTAVRHLGLDRWTKLGRRSLTGEVAKPVVSFTQDDADFRECVIFDTAGMERNATPEECVGLERASSWDARGIERRLLDAFLGHPNEAALRARVRLE